MYNSFRFVTHRFVFLIVALAFPCSAPLVVQANLLEVNEIEKSGEIAEGVIVASQGNRDQRERKTSLVVKIEINDAGNGDVVPRGSIESAFAGHRLITGDVAPFRC